MEDQYLCFESFAFLFLIPLNHVEYIMPAAQVTDGGINYKNRVIAVLDFQTIWKENPPEKKSHVIIIRDGSGGYFGLMAEAALEVIKIEAGRKRKLPEEVISRKNSFISEAVYLEGQDQWAYMIDGDKLLEAEGI